MVFELTDEQEQFFKIVLMCISNERKSALIQLLDSGSAISVSDSLDRISERFPNMGQGDMTKTQIQGIFDVLSPLELAVLEFVPSRQAWRGNTKAFRLTVKGEEVKRYAGFALERMAREFDQSIYPVLGMINSTYDEVRPQQAVRLLYAVNEGPVSVKDLMNNSTLAVESGIYDILNKFTSFKDGQGNAIPLVEIWDSKIAGGIKGYRWVSGSLIPANRRATERSKRLIAALSSDSDRVWTLHELANECSYTIYEEGRTHPLNQILNRLVDKGNMTSGYYNELRTVHITNHGRRLIYSLFEPIRGSIAGDQVSNGIIDRNQPTPSDVVRVLGLYAGIKDREKSGEPVAYQMQGK